MLLLREALESVAVRRACEVMDIERGRPAAPAAHPPAAGCGRRGRRRDFLELDEEFHLKIAEGAGLPILHSFLSASCAGSCESRGSACRARPAVLVEVVDEHERIVDAIEPRDVDAALRALNDHLQRSDYAVPAEAAT